MGTQGNEMELVVTVHSGHCGLNHSQVLIAIAEK